MLAASVALQKLTGISFSTSPVVDVEHLLPEGLREALFADAEAADSAGDGDHLGQASER